MRTQALVAVLLLGLAGCSLTIDPGKVPEPPASGCVPTGCAGKACGYVDCGTTCQPGSGCSGTCVPACSGKACGSSDGCGGTCSAGSGCVAAGAMAVEGGLTEGGASLSGGTHQVQGTVSQGSPPQTLQSTNYRVEQGTLR